VKNKLELSNVKFNKTIIILCNTHPIYQEAYDDEGHNGKEYQRIVRVEEILNIADGAAPKVSFVMSFHF